MKKLALFLSFGLLMMACSKQEEVAKPDTAGKIVLTQDEVNVLSFISPREMNTREVLTHVESFVLALSEEPKTRSDVFNPSFSITKKTFINPEGEFTEKDIATRSGEIDEFSAELTAPIYEVAVNSKEGEGLVMVSGDAMHPTVLAYIPKVGDEFMMEMSGANDMLNISKQAYVADLLLKKNQADTVKIGLLDKISSKLNMPINEITYDNIKDRIIVEGALATRSTAIPGRPAGTQLNSMETISPKVKTNWGQGNPYNGAFWINPNLTGTVDLGDGWGGRYDTPWPAGCVNVAIAQALSFTKHWRGNMPSVGIPSANIPWEYITSPDIESYSGPGYFGVQHLLKWLCEKNNSYPVTNSNGHIVATSTDENRMVACLKALFLCDNKARFNADNMWAALKKNRIAITTIGDDHVMIISGMLVTSIQQTRQLVAENDVYWHANLGWANACTGYYKVRRPQADCLFEAGQYAQWDYQMYYWNNIRALTSIQTSANW